jgi:hypothetical protein
VHSQHSTKFGRIHDFPTRTLVYESHLPSDTGNILQIIMETNLAIGYIFTDRRRKQDSNLPWKLYPLTHRAYDK